MKRILLVSITILLGVLNISSAIPQHPGREPHVPTKQEWVVISAGTCFLGAGGNSVASVFAGDDPEAIRVDLIYNGQASAREVDVLYKLVRLSVEGTAARHGWSEWVRLDRRDHVQNTNDKFSCPGSY